jgi:phosphinothricin acetyltransferase
MQEKGMRHLQQTAAGGGRPQRVARKRAWTEFLFAARDYKVFRVSQAGSGAGLAKSKGHRITDGVTVTCNGLPAFPPRGKKGPFQRSACMHLQIRDITLDDLPAVTSIYSDSVRNGTASYEIVAPGLAEMTARYEALIAKGYPYLGAVDEGGILLGYAYASAFRTRPAYRWLVEDSIYIHPDARGQGVGKALLANLLQRCEMLGFRQMVAVIGGASEGSMGVHRSCGFEVAGRLVGTGFKHGLWLDTVFMQKALGDGKSTPPDLTAFPGSLD